MRRRDHRNPKLARPAPAQRELRGATPGTLETFLAPEASAPTRSGPSTPPASAGELARATRVGTPPSRSSAIPGLATHPTHQIAAEQLASFGSVISFDVTGGASAADHVCAASNVIRHATSFGAVESTIERRAAIPGQHHLPPGLLRLSVGIEHVDDLWDDLRAALAHCIATPRRRPSPASTQQQSTTTIVRVLGLPDLANVPVGLRGSSVRRADGVEQLDGGALGPVGLEASVSLVEIVSLVCVGDVSRNVTVSLEPQENIDTPFVNTRASGWLCPSATE